MAWRRRNAVCHHKNSTHGYCSPVHTPCIPPWPPLTQLNIYKRSDREEIQYSPDLQHSWMSLDLHSLDSSWHHLSLQLLVSKTGLQPTTASCACVKYHCHLLITLLWMSGPTWLCWLSSFSVWGPQMTGCGGKAEGIPSSSSHQSPCRILCAPPRGLGQAAARPIFEILMVKRLYNWRTNMMEIAVRTDAT